MSQNNHDPIWSNLLSQIWRQQDEIKSAKQKLDQQAAEWLREIESQRTMLVDMLSTCYRRLNEYERQIRAAVPANKLPAERK